MLEKTLFAPSMVCSFCETRIQDRLAKEPGIHHVKADYKNSLIHLRYDPAITSIPIIIELLEKMDYFAAETVLVPKPQKQTAFLRTLGVIFLLLSIAVAGNYLGLFSFVNIFPEAKKGMGLGMLFLTGVLTSVHCLAMCGGINISQTALSARALDSKSGSLTATFLYATGRVISYTLIGGIIGAMGSVISMSNTGKAGIQIAAGIFMALMGLNLMGIFPWLHRFIPHLPKFLAKNFSGYKQNGPFLVGLLNGLMPCGPLQAMQLFALSTSSPLQGALSMAAFGLGTLPLTMGLGIFASRLGKRFMGKTLRVGAAMVFLMGLSMLGNGLSLAGFILPALSVNDNIIAAKIEQNKQTLETTLRPNAFQAISVEPGLPLVWKIIADRININGCNNRILIPEFGIEHKLVPGENIIKFTPKKPGIYPYMCWMGMITSRIVVGNVKDSGKTPKFDESVLPKPDKDYNENVPWL